MRQHSSSARASRQSGKQAATIRLVAACLTLSTSAAAGSISREQAMARALGSHAQVSIVQAVENQARARHAQVQAARYPSVSVTLGVGPSLKAQLVPGTAVQSTENAYGDVGLSDLSVVVGGQLEVLQPLYTFGKISHRLQATRFEVQARKAQTEAKRAEVALEVATFYETFLFARDMRRFLEETQHWLLRTIEDTEEEIAANTGATEQDLLMLRAALGGIRLAHSEAQAGFNQLNAALVAHLAYPLGTELVPAEDLLELLPGAPTDASALIELALLRRPELRGLALGKKAFDELAAAQAAGNLPDVFALAFASGAYTPGRDFVDSRFATDSLNHFIPGLLVGARWVWQGPSARERASESQAQASELAHTETWARQILPAEVTRAFEDLQRATRDTAQAEVSSKHAKAWLVRASADYAVGLGSSRNLSDAAQAFVQLRVASFDARLRHNVALAALAKATGSLTGGSSRFYPTGEIPYEK